MKHPMLASSTDGLNLTYPLLASPKLDGVRALIMNGKVMSRSFKPIPNQFVQDLFGNVDFNGLDGELIVGAPTASNAYRATSSGVMSIEGKPEVKLYVFDDFSFPGRYQARFESVRKRLKKRPTLIVVEQLIISSHEDLQWFEEQCLRDGYEGVMLRHPDSPYKQGRATPKEGYLMKLKRFEDSEAEIIGVQELMRNTNLATINETGHQERSLKQAGMVKAGTLGALMVRDLKTGVEFEIGTGFDQRARGQLWVQRNRIIGKTVKYKFFPTGSKEKPRFPVYLGFRDKIDL